MVLERGVEADVRPEDGGPGDEAGDGGDGDEPVEHGTAVGGDVHVGQQTDGTSNGQGPNGYAIPGAVPHEPGCLAEASHAVEGTRGGEQVGVASGEGGNKDDGVDEGGETLDTCVVDGNDEGGGGSTCTTEDEIRVVVRNQPADDPHTTDVEEDDTVEDAADSLGHVTTGVLRFASCEGNDLSSEERESGVDEGGPEGQETTLGTGNTVELIEGAGVLPVAETNTVVARSTSKVKDDAHNDETDDGHDLDEREPELRLAVVLHTAEVEGIDDGEENGDEDRDVGGGIPELDDEGGSSDFGGEGGRVGVPVVPTEGETNCGVDETGCVVGLRV